ncbi:MAG: Lrp/AsnC family transcriptional regulator, partial [Pseudomonadota bacterium]
KIITFEPELMSQSGTVSTLESSPIGGFDKRSSPKDHLNQQIIALLQQDGRLPYKDMADVLNVSEGTIRNRVNRMRDSGALKIVALTDPSAIRYQSDAMIGIKVSNRSTPARVAERLSAEDEVIYAVWVTGRFDLLIEVVCDRQSDFQTFLQSHCYGQDDISQFEVMTAIDMFKNQFFLKRQPINSG